MTSAALHASLTQSRQTWTHSAFSRLMTPDTSSDRQSSVQQHTHTTGLSLAGVCTVRIGPHIFLDTKFYTLSSNAAPLPPPSPHHMPNDAAAVQQESPPRPHHQVAMEFKENPGTHWLFPEEASLELTPATDCESAQISASFYLPIPEKTEQGRTWTGASTQAINLVILQATTALWEGLQQAIRGPHITTPRSVINKRQSAVEDTRLPSTDDEDPSEILGSGKHSSSSNVFSSKRNPDIGNDPERSMKSKRPRSQDEKSPVSSSKKTTGKVGTGSGAGVGSGTATGKKSAPAGPSSSHSSQKKCGYCSCTTTPMWRRGPHGPSTLCNACGVKWKHGKIMQDATDTQVGTSAAASSSKPGHGAGASAHRSGSSKTTGKSENGHDRDQDQDDKRVQSKAAGRRSSAAPTRRDQGSPDRSSASRESSNGSRSVDSERIVPVKKRHLSKATPSRPPGPRMVPIHELDNVTRMPAKPQPIIDKYEDDDDEEERLLLNGRAKRRKNGFDPSIPKVSSDIASAGAVTETPDASENKEIVPKSNNIAVHPPPRSLEAAPSTDDGLLLYSRNLYTNNTATFPLHFPTISIAFGPNNDYYTYPNCAVVLFENHFQIKLIHAGERTEIDVWKEGIEGTEFQVVDVGDGESMIVMKALLRQYLTRFDKELLNPDRNESLIVFRFRERLDGGGPFVKPLLEHWLATDIPVPPPTSADSA
ncbi:hypothetical protein KVV02_005346 [Mortierella alpina]|uniref:GATA-type domain-containing protein n=1 Tax=Mortierella alpina TaxID=64518 RepID=A0A9P8A6Y8_MORAP|nr:hypothetical protein KVV02_005346 [Mortierella alpina]